MTTPTEICKRLRGRERSARMLHQRLYADELASYASCIEAQAVEIERLMKALSEARDYVVAARDAYGGHPANRYRVAEEQAFLDEIDAALTTQGGGE